MDDVVIRPKLDVEQSILSGGGTPHPAPVIKKCFHGSDFWTPPPLSVIPGTPPKVCVFESKHWGRAKYELCQN